MALLGLVFFTSVALRGQLNAPKIKNHKTTGDLKPVIGTNGQKEDWLLSVKETSDGKIVASGFAGGVHYIGSGTGNPNSGKAPAMVYYTSGLNIIWEKYFETADFGGTSYNITEAYMEDVIENGDYFVGVGQCKVINRPTNNGGYLPFIVKIDKTGTLANGYPKLFADHDFDDNGTFFQIIYYPGNQSYYLAARYRHTNLVSPGVSTYAMIFKLDNDFDVTASSKITSTGYLDGDIMSLCFIYPNGANKKGQPMVANEAPTGIGFTGSLIDRSIVPNPSDVIVGKCDLNLSNLTYLTVNSPINSSAFYDNTSILTQRGNGPCPGNTDASQRNSDDRGVGIVQMNDGKLAVAQLWNKVYLLDDPNDWTQDEDANLCAAAVGHREQIIDADGVVQIYNHATNLTLHSEKHVMHLNGDDFDFKIHLDDDGHFLLSGTTADDNKLQDPTHRDEYLFVKLNNDITVSNPIIWWRTAAGEGNTDACSFDFISVANNSYLAIGNNHESNGPDEDFDYLLLGKECQANYSLNKLAPNVTSANLKVGYDADVDFSLETWWVNKGGGSKILNIGTSGTVASRIIVENGFTLRFLPNLNLNIEFPRLDNIFDLENRKSFDNMNIIVQPGGKLIIGKDVTLKGLSNSCVSNWNGISLEAGNNGLPGGELEMGTAIIQDAICAVRAKFNNKVIIGSNNGGVPQFVNCAKSLEFLGDNGSNNSRFFNTKFVCTQPLIDRDGKGVNAHITLFNTHGIYFWGCSFENTYAGVFADNYRGTGIGALDAHFFVLPNQNVVNNNPCFSPIASNPSYFNNLSLGVYAGFSNTANIIGNPVKVLGNLFENCNHSVAFAGGNGCVAYDNQIKHTNGLRGLDPIFMSNSTVGVSSIGTHDIHIDENNFDAITNPPNMDWYGIYIDNSHSNNVNNATSTSYKNIMNASAWGNPAAWGHIVSGDNSTLDIHCNEYSNFRQGWLISGPGGLKNQGDSKFPAENKFTQLLPCLPLNQELVPGEMIHNLAPTRFDYFYYGLCSTPLNKNLAPNENPSRLINVTSLPSNNNLNYCFTANPCNPLYYTASMAQLYQAEYEGLPASPPGGPASNIETIMLYMAQGNYNLAKAKWEQLDFTIKENSEYKDYLKIAIPLLSSENKNLTTADLVTLRNIKKANTSVSNLAANLLYFFNQEPYSLAEIPKSSVAITAAQRHAIENGNAGVQDISLSPNPVLDILHIHGLSSTDYSIEIYNSNGQQVAKQAQANATFVPVSGLKSGIYVIKIISNHTFSTHKFVKL